MSIYVPNSGEKEALKAVLQQQALIVGLFGTAIVPDGSTVFGTLTELTAGGVGYGYAPVPLSNDVLESVTPTAGKWTIITNAAGKAEAVYGAVALEWVFLAPDVALGQTCYGVYYTTRVLAFTAGLQPIKVGDVIYQGTTIAAEVTGVNVTSGSWYLGTAAGNLYLKRQAGVFAAGSILVGSKPTATSEIKVLTVAPVVGGTGYAVGDLFMIGTGSGGIGRVTAVTGGVVTAVELLAGGKDYTVATQATTKISGAGDNALTVAVESLYTAGPAVAVATIAADSNKVLVAVESLTTSIPITTLGQKISLQPRLSMSTG